jgi:hypothetical protein
MSRPRTPSPTRTLLMLAALLSAFAWPAAAQRTGTPTAAMDQAADTGQAAQRAGRPAPQTFDWWAAAGVPAATPWGQPVDTAATRLMRSWTTSPEFTNPIVDHLPYDARVVSPMDHWGYPSGQPGTLHRVDELYGYYDALAESSPRARME